LLRRLNRKKERKKERKKDRKKEKTNIQTRTDVYNSGERNEMIQNKEPYIKFWNTAYMVDKYNLRSNQTKK